MSLGDGIDLWGNNGKKATKNGAGFTSDKEDPKLIDVMRELQKAFGDKKERTMKKLDDFY